MYLLHLRPLFVELPIFVLDGLVLLEPRDLVREQTRRNLRRAAADLRGGKSAATAKLNGSLPVYVPAARASSASSCDAPASAAA